MEKIPRSGTPSMMNEINFAIIPKYYHISISLSNNFMDVMIDLNFSWISLDFLKKLWYTYYES